MDFTELQFIKMSPKAVVPTKATKYSIRLDLYSLENYLIHPKRQVLSQFKLDLGYLQDIMVELLPNLV